MRLPTPLLAAGALLLASTGCGGGEDPVASSSGTPTVSTPTAVPTVTVSPPGRVQVTAGPPPGFPTTIPLYPAEVIGGAPGEPGARFDWSVVLRPTGEPAAIAATAAQLLEGAGFTAGEGLDQPDLQVLQYSDGSYVVGVTVTRTGDGVTMTYAVSEK